MKFTIEQLSTVTGWEPKKLAKLFVLLKKNSGAYQDQLLTKLAQAGQGVGKGMVNPVGDVVEGLSRELPERAPAWGGGTVPLVQHIAPVINRIKSSPMPPPDADNVVGLLQDIEKNPSVAEGYLPQVKYLVSQNPKAWANAMGAPNSAEWKRLMAITGGIA